MSDRDLGWDLKAEEAAFFALSLDLSLEELLNFGILAKLLIGAEGDVLFLGPLFKHGLVGNYDGDQISLEGVTVAEDLGDIERLLKFALYLIRGNVLSLSKLKDVLLSINNLESTVGEEHANVTSVYPALSIDCLAGLLRITEVTLEVVVTLVADLTSRHRSTCLILILTCVVHFWDVNKLNIEATVWATDVP